MASPTWWAWVWVNSGSWWWTGRPGVLRFMGSQRVRHDWATELNWTELNWTESCLGFWSAGRLDLRGEYITDVREKTSPRKRNINTPFLAPTVVYFSDRRERWRSYYKTKIYKIFVKVCFFTSDLGCGSDCSTSVLDVRRSKSHQDLMNHQDFLTITLGPKETMAGTERGLRLLVLLCTEKVHCHSALLWLSSPLLYLSGNRDKFHSCDFLHIYWCWASTTHRSSQDVENIGVHLGTFQCSWWACLS